MSTTLESLCTLLTDGTHYTPPNIGDGMPFLTVADMQSSGLNFQTCSRIAQSEFIEADRQNSAPKRGDVLFSKDGTVGKVHVINDEGPFAVLSSIAIIRPDPKKLNPNYLAHFLRSPSAISAAERSKTGSALRRIILKDIKRLHLTPPPLPEQRRIAAILDQADALRRLRRQSIVRLEQVEQALFFETFGDPTNNSKNWSETSILGDVADVASGITKGRKLNGHLVRAVPYLAVSNVQDGHIRLGTVKTIEATNAEIERYRLRSEDILLTEGGDPDKLGRGGIWHGEITECIHQNHVFRVRITSPEVDALYLSLLIASQRGRRYFLRSAKQTTGIASINMAQLKQFPLLLPPHAIQIRFKEMMRNLGERKKKMLLAAERTESLFTSLQHRAFRGEL